MSSPGSLLQTISMLVHECSHQYFHSVQWSCPVVEDDAPQGFSILKEINRPLDKILLGFHAFGNVLYAFSCLRGNSAVDQIELEAQVRHVRRYVDDLQTQLEQQQQWLTQTGKELYLPLKALLASKTSLAA
jgi:HEXXH motif-containing protein